MNAESKRDNEVLLAQWNMTHRNIYSKCHEHHHCPQAKLINRQNNRSQSTHCLFERATRVRRNFKRRIRKRKRTNNLPSSPGSTLSSIKSIVEVTSDANVSTDPTKRRVPYALNQKRLRDPGTFSSRMDAPSVKVPIPVPQSNAAITPSCSISCISTLRMSGAECMVMRTFRWTEPASFGSTLIIAPKTTSENCFLVIPESALM